MIKCRLFSLSKKNTHKAFRKSIGHAFSQSTRSFIYSLISVHLIIVPEISANIFNVEPTKGVSCTKERTPRTTLRKTLFDPERKALHCHFKLRMYINEFNSTLIPALKRIIPSVMRLNKYAYQIQSRDI